MTHVVTSGPLFDGRADRAASDACDETEQRVATLGAATTRHMLSEVLRVESIPPYYRNQVEAQADPPGWKITDQGVIYGPWLDGTGSRNRTTRFKGYATFRRATQVINGRAKLMAEQVVARFMGRMN